MKRLNQYLLIHFPTLWATQFQYLFIYGLVWFVVLIEIAYKIPLTYNSTSNPTYIIIFLSFLCTMFYMWWLKRQRVLAYQKLFGITGKFFFLKAVLVAFIGILVSGAVFVVPFIILNKRLEKRHLDPVLPALELSGMQGQVYTSIIFLRPPIPEDDKFAKSTIDALTDFSSSYSDSSHSFRQSFGQKLSAAKMVETYLLNSGLGVDSILINRPDGIIQAYYSAKTSPSFAKGMQIINFNNFKDRQLKTSLYGDQIFERTYTGNSKDRKLSVHIQIYYYHSPNSIYYRYCDGKTIQASLLVDKMLLQIRETTRKATLERLDAMIDTVKQVGKISYLAYGIALFYCFFITLILFVGYFFELKNSSFIFGAYLSLNMGISLFLPRFGVYLSMHLPVVAFILLSSMVIVFLLSIRSYRTDLAVAVALISMLIPSSVIIWMLIQGKGNFADGSLILNINLIQLFSGNLILSSITGVFLLILLPWFFAARMHRLSILPSK